MPFIEDNNMIQTVDRDFLGIVKCINSLNLFNERDIPFKQVVNQGV